MLFQNFLTEKIMPLKNKETKLNESKNNTNKSVFFFNDRQSNKKINVKLSTSKQLKSNKPIKYSTVFMLDKTNLKVTDEDIELPKENIVTETLKEATEKVEEQKSSKSKWFNLAFLVINILVLTIVLIYQGNTLGIESLEVLKENAKISVLIYAFLLFGVIMLLETLRTHILLYKATKQTRLILCYKASAISRYYDCITPFATGGQPFEIFYLNNRGVHGGIATAVPLTKSIFGSLSFILVSLIVLTCGADLFGADQHVIITWGIISLVISCLILLVLILFAISKKTMPKILMFFLKLGYKMHLVKNYHVTFNKCMRTILEYQKSSKFYITNWWVTLSSILIYSMIIIVKALIPFMLYWAFNDVVSGQIMLEIFSKFILVELATKYIPIPGGTGVAEISFSALFASLFNDGTLFWAMLFWRILNYFIYLFQGIIVIVYDFAYGNKKNRANKINIIKKEQEIMEKTKRLKLEKQQNSKQK